MSAAAGITLVPDEKRNPLNTTTYGVGELILHAIEKMGCRHFLIGIGGSATNDGGLGMLSALGFKFLDKDGKPVPHFGRGLRDIVKIDASDCLPSLENCSFQVACDVNNPLCGEFGCSRIYGPQKGATEEIIDHMDAWLSSYAVLTKAVFQNADANYPGAGAAGGLGFAFLSYLHASLTSGIEIVMRITELEDQIQDADIVVTGERRLDAQSCMGKAPVGVAKIAKKYGKPVIAFSGAVAKDAGPCNEYGIDVFFPIVCTPCSLKDAMNSDNAYTNLKNTAEQAFRLIKTFSKIK
jgi:glycerate kinase